MVIERVQRLWCCKCRGWRLFQTSKSLQREPYLPRSNIIWRSIWCCKYRARQISKHTWLFKLPQVMVMLEVVMVVAIREFLVLRCMSIIEHELSLLCFSFKNLLLLTSNFLSFHKMFFYHLKYRLYDLLDKFAETYSYLSSWSCRERIFR